VDHLGAYHRTDGTSQGEWTGASPFPRHWVYDRHGQLIAKSGLASFHHWQRTAFGTHSPRGQEDSKPLVTVAESALERQLSATIMRGGIKPAIRKIAKGALLAEQGEPGHDVYLLLDGVLSVWVDRGELGELGPGAVVGERALLEIAAGPPPCARSPAALSPPPRTRSTVTPSPALPSGITGKTPAGEPGVSPTLRQSAIWRPMLRTSRPGVSSCAPAPPAGDRRRRWRPPGAVGTAFPTQPASARRPENAGRPRP
jgi:Cyclic nucleotide-binding domain